MLFDSAYRVNNCDLPLYQQSAETSSLDNAGVSPVLWTWVWLNIFLEHCGLTFFSEKQPMILKVPSKTSDFQRGMPGTSKESKPHTQHMFWTGHPKQMVTWKQATVFWTLPNISEYSDEEVMCPLENCKLFRNARHQKRTWTKAKLKKKKKCRKCSRSALALKTGKTSSSPGSAVCLWQSWG